MSDDNASTAAESKTGSTACPEPPAQDAPGGAAGGDATADAAASTPTVEQLQAQLEAATAESQERWEMVLRARAELDNVRRRAERDVENAHKYGLERFVAELLPVKDSLELGLSAAAERAGDADSVREGVELTLKMLDSALEKFGVTAVDPGGEGFDPEYHQAMSTQEAPGAEPGTVLTVVQKGYVLNDRLVRPAMVIVAK